MTRGLPAALVLVAGTACLPALALESYVVLDDFNAANIDISKWSDQERIRSVSGNVLRMQHREAGTTADNTSQTAITWSTNITRPTPATQIRGVIRVNSISIGTCAGNTSYTSAARARIIGSFFSTGNRVANNLTGDVLAQAWLVRRGNSTDGADVLRVEGAATVCRNSDCSLGTSLGPIVALGTATVGQDVTLAVEWDKATKTFNFIRDNGAATGSITYTLNDSIEPGTVFKQFSTRIEVPNCTAARTVNAVDATFDTFSVNTKAKP
jgi:hypothetical protein